MLLLLVGERDDGAEKTFAECYSRFAGTAVTVKLACNVICDNCHNNPPRLIGDSGQVAPHARGQTADAVLNTRVQEGGPTRARTDLLPW